MDGEPGAVETGVALAIERGQHDGFIDRVLDAGISILALRTARLIDDGIATREDTRDLMQAIKTLRELLGRMRLTPVDRTTGEPTIDLSELTAEFSRATNGDPGTLGD